MKIRKPLTRFHGLCRPYDPPLRIEQQTLSRRRLRHKYAVTQMPSVALREVSNKLSDLSTDTVLILPLNRTTISKYAYRWTRKERPS